jgi:hypothetical protein
VLGDPLRIVSFENDTRRIARYWLAGSNSTYVLVIEERGYVTSFDAFTDAVPRAEIASVPADPFGVRLGETYAAVKATPRDLLGDVDEDGVSFLVGKASSTIGVEYTFADGRLHSFQWVAPIPSDKPALAPLAESSGDAPASAILDLQPDERDGAAWEYQYLTFHPCGGTARWRLEQQKIVNENGRTYDRLHVVCPATSVQRDFYFDRRLNTVPQPVSTPPPSAVP